MNTEQIEILKFRVVKNWAKEMLHKKTSYADAGRYTTFQDELNKKGLEDAQVLLRMIFREVESYNAKIKTKISLIDRMNYTRKWEESACFKGLSIPHKEIDNLIKANPEKEYFDIVRMLMGWSIAL